MKFDAILLKEFKDRVAKQSEIERFNRAKLKLQGKALKLGDEIVKTQGEVIELQQQGITHLDQQKQELQVEVKELKSTQTFLNYRCQSIRDETLNEIDNNELKKTLSQIDLATVNSEPKTGVDEHSYESELDQDEPFGFVIGKDENGRGSITRKRKF